MYSITQEDPGSRILQLDQNFLKPAREWRKFSQKLVYVRGGSRIPVGAGANPQGVAQTHKFAKLHEVKKPPLDPLLYVNPCVMSNQGTNMF